MGLKRFEGVSSTAKWYRCLRPLLGLPHLHPLSLHLGTRKMPPWERLIEEPKKQV